MTKETLKKKIRSYRGGPGSGRKPSDYQGLKVTNIGQQTSKERVTRLYNAYRDAERRYSDLHFEKGDAHPQTKSAKSNLDFWSKRLGEATTKHKNQYGEKLINGEFDRE